MAITAHTAKHVTWPTTAKTKSVASAGSESSEDYTFETNAFDAKIIVKSDHGGTPVSGDDIYIYADIETDPDDDSTDENTNQSNLIGCITHYPEGAAEDIVKAPFLYTCLPGEICKFRAVNDGATACVVSIEVRERKSA